MKRNFFYSKIFPIFLFCFSWQFISAQNGILNVGQIHGNLQTDVQYYNPDSTIGAEAVPEKLLMNGFANLIYTNGHFSAGLRYESYQNALQGFDARYKGNGIPYRYATYSTEGFEFTVGSFYEQFGSGLVFRTYEERNLGYDNALDGVRIKYMPFKGVTIKGIIGNQRFFFDKGPGIVRGADGEVSLVEFLETTKMSKLLQKLQNQNIRIIVGGSFVSKYQKDQDPIFKLPENVGAWSTRAVLGWGKFDLSGEYANKINDPSAINGYIYKPGEALILSGSYSQKGLSISFSGKRIDNMNFRSDRTASGNALSINYLPTISKQHVYTLSAMYPYATQPNGEIGYQGTVIYNMKKNTPLGGNYGMDISINYSKVNEIDKNKLPDSTYMGYTSEFFKIGKATYFEDLNIEVSKKFSKRVKAIFSYVYLAYNIDIIQGHPGAGMMYGHVGIADITYKIKDRHSIRLELQHLYTKQDEKSWALGLLEYTINPKWFFTVMDQYNYANDDTQKRIHYYTLAFGYTKDTHRFSISYGKQRSGIVCVGGVCRQVPASNGISLTITSSF